MRIQNQTITLKDGRPCILRNPHPEDAADLIEYMKVTAGETRFILRYPEEVTMTVQQEEAFLQNALEDSRSLMVMAEVDGEVAGNASISGVGMRQKLLHRCSVAITLYQKFWNQGIGTALMNLLLEKAGEMGYEQAELEVAGSNKRAIALYEKVGFRQTGYSWHALKYKDGSYDDLLLMVKKL